MGQNLFYSKYIYQGIKKYKNINAMQISNIKNQKYLNEHICNAARQLPICRAMIHKGSEARQKETGYTIAHNKTIIIIKVINAGIFKILVKNLNTYGFVRRCHHQIM